MYTDFIRLFLAYRHSFVCLNCDYTVFSSGRFSVLFPSYLFQIYMHNHILHIYIFRYLFWMILSHRFLSGISLKTSWMFLLFFHFIIIQRCCSVDWLVLFHSSIHSFIRPFLRCFLHYHILFIYCHWMARVRIIRSATKIINKHSRWMRDRLDEKNNQN